MQLVEPLERAKKFGTLKPGNCTDSFVVDDDDAVGWWSLDQRFAATEKWEFEMIPPRPHVTHTDRRTNDERFTYHCSTTATTVCVTEQIIEIALSNARSLSLVANVFDVKKLKLRL